MKNILLVGLGEFLGSVSRYKIGGWILHQYPMMKFPLSTFVVNVCGCFVIGVVSAVAGAKGHLPIEKCRSF